MSALHYLIIVLAIVILAPIVRHIIQDRDFKRQVSGKRPMRQIKEEEPLPGTSPKPFDPELEACKNVTLLRAKQQLWRRL